MRVNLASLQAREDTTGRPPLAGDKKRGDDRRCPPASRPSILTAGSHPQTGRGRGSSSQGRHGPPLPSTESRASGVDGKRKCEVVTPQDPKKGRGDPAPPSRGPRKSPLLLEGVNAKESVGSFWDSEDPNKGWKKGREIICDYDIAHLVPQSPAALSHSLALIGCQVLFSLFTAPFVGLL